MKSKLKTLRCDDCPCQCGRRGDRVRRGQPAADPDERGEGCRRSVRGEARLGYVQARRPHRRQGHRWRKNQLSRRLPCLWHPLVLATVRHGIRNRLQTGQRHLSARLRVDCAGADRRHLQLRRNRKPNYLSWENANVARPIASSLRRDFQCGRHAVASGIGHRRSN